MANDLVRLDEVKTYDGSRVLGWVRKTVSGAYDARTTKESVWSRYAGTPNNAHAALMHILEAPESNAGLS